MLLDWAQPDIWQDVSSWNARSNKLAFCVIEVTKACFVERGNKATAVRSPTIVQKVAPGNPKIARSSHERGPPIQVSGNNPRFC